MKLNKKLKTEKFRQFCPKCNSDDIEMDTRYSSDTDTGGIVKCNNCSYFANDSFFKEKKAICPKCNSSDLKIGTIYSHDSTVIMYVCKDCGFADEDNCFFSN